jgi:predicted cupin superfamily sugar epimerase
MSTNDTSVSSTGRPLPAAAVAWIRHFKMERIPQEGAWFAPAFQSDETLAPGAFAARYTAPRLAYNSIYGVQTTDDFSGLHRLRTDELWHHYEGSPLQLLMLHPDGRGETVMLGKDLAAGHRPQWRVPRDVWQGSRPIGSDAACALIGNSMAPGFDYADFEIGYREELQAQYPEFSGLIAALTRDEHGRRPAAE